MVNTECSEILTTTSSYRSQALSDHSSNSSTTFTSTPTSISTSTFLNSPDLNSHIHLPSSIHENGNGNGNIKSELEAPRFDCLATDDNDNEVGLGVGVGAGAGVAGDEMSKDSELYRQIMEIIQSGCVDQSPALSHVAPTVGGVSGGHSTPVGMGMDHVGGRELYGYGVGGNLTVGDTGAPPVYGCSNQVFDIGESHSSTPNPTPAGMSRPSTPSRYTVPPSTPYYTTTPTYSPSFTPYNHRPVPPTSSLSQVHNSPMFLPQSTNLLPPFEIDASASVPTTPSIPAYGPTGHQVIIGIPTLPNVAHNVGQQNWLEDVKPPFDNFDNALEHWRNTEGLYQSVTQVQSQSPYAIQPQHPSVQIPSCPSVGCAATSQTGCSPLRGRPAQSRPLTGGSLYPGTPDSVDWSTLPPTPALTSSTCDGSTPHSRSLSRSSSISNISRLAGGSIPTTLQTQPHIAHPRPSTSSSTSSSSISSISIASPIYSFNQPRHQRVKDETNRVKQHFCPETECPRHHRSFGSNADLQRHINMHRGYKPFSCSVEGCEKAYGQRNKLVKHVVREHGLDEGRIGSGMVGGMEYVGGVKREAGEVELGGKRARTSLSRVAVLRTAG